MTDTVVILGGGDSPEREVSLRSAEAIYKAALVAGLQATKVDPKDGVQQLDALASNIAVLPILHGVGGEDGDIQAELEKRHLSFLGTGSKASEIAFDKWLSKQAFNVAGIPNPKGELVTKQQYFAHELTKAPHILKASRNGSSLGIYLVKDPSSIDSTEVDKVFAYGEEALLEELIEGIEITVPVLGNQTLPVIEIIPPAGKAFDYENKYNGKTQELCPPVNVSEQLQKAAQELAIKTHHALHCLHLSRTDIIIKPSGEMVVLEINTMPGMTNQSLYPRSAAVFGISFPDLVKEFAEMAVTEKRY